MKRQRAHAELEKRIGYRFKNPKLLELALTHPSYRNESGNATGDNQRLEFLGDAVLSLLCADTLYRAHGMATEGQLTKMRSALTCAAALATVSRKLGMDEHIKLGKGEQMAGGHTRPGALADALEALVGAIFLDGGFEVATRVAAGWPFGISDVEYLLEHQTNPKGVLQELLQKKRMTPTYRIREATGPAHARHFIAELRVENELIATGEGSSKRVAENAAAASALQIVTTGLRSSSRSIGGIIGQ